jgi:hypothetical protein
MGWTSERISYRHGLLSTVENEAQRECGKISQVPSVDHDGTRVALGNLRMAGNREIVNGAASRMVWLKYKVTLQVLLRHVLRHRWLGTSRKRYPNNSSDFTNIAKGSNDHSYDGPPARSRCEEIQPPLFGPTFPPCTLLGVPACDTPWAWLLYFARVGPVCL